MLHLSPSHNALFPTTYHTNHSSTLSDSRHVLWHTPVQGASNTAENRRSGIGTDDTSGAMMFLVNDARTPVQVQYRPRAQMSTFDPFGCAALEQRRVKDTAKACCIRRRKSGLLTLPKIILQTLRFETLIEIIRPVSPLRTCDLSRCTVHDRFLSKNICNVKRL